MSIRPSIVLEGASRAADWVPYATTMLANMVGGGTRNFSPEEGITVVITRHGSVAKIYIRAEYPEGFRFVGTPYTSVNTGGWGTPYDEDHPQGTPGSFNKREVIVEKNKGVWTAKRYPRYKPYYPDLEFGNMDWTSADGQTVLTWDGPNSPHASEMTYNALLAGACCTENKPNNEWHVGYHYPGFISCYSANCNLVVYLPHKVLAVDSQLPTDYEDKPMIGSKVYKDGEVLVSIAAGGEYNFEANLTDAKPLEVFGAAIQKVTDSEGETTKYLNVMLGQYAVTDPGQAAGYKTNDEYLFRAPMDDLTDFTITRILEEYSISGGGAEGLSSWQFNSTGTEAVAVRGNNGYYNTFKIQIGDEGAVIGEKIYTWDDRVPRWDAPSYPSSLSDGESYTYDGEGSNVLAVGYKDDIIRYGCIYTRRTVTKSFDIWFDSGTGCDVMDSVVEEHIEHWFAFIDDPHAMNEQAPGAFKINTEYNKNSEKHWGGITGTTTDPASMITITHSQELKHPIYIDCRYDTVLFQNTKEPTNAFSYGMIANGSAAFLMRERSVPQSYTYSTSLDLHIDGVQVFETDRDTQIRSPGDCYTTSIYSLSSGKTCSLAGYTFVLGSNQDEQAFSALVLFSSIKVTSFGNIQIHKTNPDAPDFDILFTARTKYADGFTGSFIAHWDGEALIDRQDISTLLDIDDDGVLATTGKI